MRIIGGDSRGRVIHSPKQGQMRPTSDGIRESLFNILQTITGKSFLDLFAGSGSVGLEALSRGAEKVVFVEKNAVMVNTIKQNLRELSPSGEYQVLHMEAAKAVKTFEKKGETFDIVFADPPYDRGFVKDVLISLVGGGDILRADGVLVIQHSKREIVDKDSFSRDFVLTDQRRYGDTNLSFFKK